MSTPSCGPGPVATPASRTPRPTVLVLGAGVAGLTAAHELADRGFGVTVVEPHADERVAVGDLPPEAYPPVKLGGLAASQYSTCAPPRAGDHVRLRAFPGRRGSPRQPGCAVPGEHGFRFFPAYYLHIWDLLQRIPIYQRPEQGSRWQRTTRTVMDNVQRVVTQATTLAGKPSLIFPRQAPRSLAELLTMVDQLGEFGGTADDAASFAARIVRYLATSPVRRASELQNLSLFDFFIGRDATAARRFAYSPAIESLLLDMPKVLAAFDSRWGDARTNISTYLQLVLRTEREDDKADGVLNGPTTEAWFDNWYHHLVAIGVRFVRATVDRLEPPEVDRRVAPHRRPRVVVVLADGTRHAADYVVCAVDAPAAERITAPLRAAGTGGVVTGLDGFTTSVPPPRGPLQPQPTRPGGSRDPYAIAAVGRQKWDRFQTLAGIQFYFDTEFQLVRGHVYYSGSEWGLSSINQQGLWENRPVLGRDGYVSRLSVDVGDFNTPSSHLRDAHGRGKAARDCTPDELAAEVWRQIVNALTNALDTPPEALLPWPSWYTLDRNLVFADGETGPPTANAAPYLVPIVGDWPNRPGADPWNPNMSSWTTRATEAAWQADLQERDVWQARHGGYQVHHNSLVFAGTWTKTFTRLTTMEAACESARHAVNAILDHYVWVGSDGIDRRGGETLEWRMPYGFLDQQLSIPMRQPSPAGDYCFVFDLENREPFDLRRLRNYDSDCARAGLPHPLDLVPPAPPTLSPALPLALPMALPLGVSAPESTGAPNLAFTVPPTAPSVSGGSPMTNPTDYTAHLLTYLQAWRQYLEQATAAATGAAPAPSDTGPQAWGPLQAGVVTPVLWPAAPAGMAATGVIPAGMPPLGTTPASSSPAMTTTGVAPVGLALTGLVPAAAAATPASPPIWPSTPAPPGPPTPPTAPAASAAPAAWPPAPSPPMQATDGAVGADYGAAASGGAPDPAPTRSSRPIGTAFPWAVEAPSPDSRDADPASLYRSDPAPPAFAAATNTDSWVQPRPGGVTISDPPPQTELIAVRDPGTSGAVPPGSSVPPFELLPPGFAGASMIVRPPWMIPGGLPGFPGMGMPGGAPWLPQRPFNVGPSRLAPRLRDGDPPPSGPQPPQDGKELIGGDPSV